MGTGDFICISMTGGAPWGFRLQGGKEQKQPLQVAKVGPPQTRRAASAVPGSGAGKPPVAGVRVLIRKPTHQFDFRAILIFRCFCLRRFGWFVSKKLGRKPYIAYM